MNFTKYFIKLLRNCAVCGQSLKPVDWLCSQCEVEFFKRVRKHQRDLSKKISHHYLVAWHPDDPFMSKSVYSLKGWGLTEAYEILADLLIQQMEEFEEKTIFYPSKTKKDHAQMLAETLGKKLRWEARPIHKITSAKQATLNREDRADLQFQPVGKYKKAIIVDDIVTTGATMRACYEALGRPKKLAVWSLFYRKLL